MALRFRIFYRTLQAITWGHPRRVLEPEHHQRGLEPERHQLRELVCHQRVPELRQGQSPDRSSPGRPLVGFRESAAGQG